MKKFLALLLALLMCVSVLASCGGNTDDAAGATLDEAKELLNSMMKDKNGKATPNDYDVVGKLTVGETVFEVTWKTDNESIKVKESSKKDFWTIDVPDVNDKEVEYKLTATIKAEDGSTVDVTFTPKLPVVDNAGVASEFEAGVAYTMFMKQANLGYTVYALNTTQNGENKYIETTMDPKAAATFYVEVVEGGYKIYTEIDGVKNYLHAELKEADGGKMSKYIGFKADSNCVFTYDKELTVFKITLNGGEYGVGTYNAFETISLSDATYFKKDNINVEGGQFPVGLMTKAHADTLAPSVKPENNDPKADSTLSIADAIALGKSKAPTVYTEGKYYVEGTVKEIKNDQYGNLIITDGTNDLLIYGTYSEDGKTRFDKLATKPAVGDKIKVYGVIGNYNNEAQMKNGWIIGAAAGEGSDDSGSSTPSVNTTVVEAPVAGTAYKFGMLQGNKDNKIFYANGEMVNTYYFGTTEDAATAIDVYLEETTGGYYLYCMKGDAKTYINMAVSGTHVNAVYASTASTVYTFDATLKTLVTDITVEEDTTKSGQYAFGNYGTYTSISTFNITKNDSFACRFYTVADGGDNSGSTPVVPTPPACTEHTDANGDYKCDTENCGVLTGVPAADSTLTVVQANALGVAHAHNTYTEGTYKVNGEILSVDKAQYGNITIKDADGNTLVIYGSTAADGTAYNDLAVKYIAGDKVTVVGIIGQFNGTAQIKNGLVTVTEQHAHVYDAGECACGATDPNYVPTHTCADANGDFVCDNADCDKIVAPAADSTLTVEQAIAFGELFENSTYSASKYYVTGVVASTPNATHGNLDLTADGKTIYIYGLWDATGDNKYGNMTDKPVKGDTITVYTVIGKYSDKAQMQNAWVTNLVVHGDNHTYEGGVCTVCGADEPVAGVTVETFAIAASAGTLSNEDTTITWESDNFTFVGNKAGSSTAIRTSDADHYRIYKDATFAINAKNNKKITKIVVTSTTAAYATALANSITADGVTVTADGTTVTIEFAAGVGSFEFTAGAQTRVASFVISYTD